MKNALLKISLFGSGLSAILGFVYSFTPTIWIVFILNVLFFSVITYCWDKKFLNYFDVLKELKKMSNKHNLNIDLKKFKYSNLTIISFRTTNKVIETNAKSIELIYDSKYKGCHLGYENEIFSLYKDSNGIIYILYLSGGHGIERGIEKKQESCEIWFSNGGREDFNIKFSLNS